MKKPLLIGVSALALLTLSATLFAQTATGSSLITQMKAAVHDFTLATDLNPGVTDLKSGPVSGKKTGDMLTAEEYNRILELVGQGGGGGGKFEITNATTKTNYNLTWAARWMSSPSNYVVAACTTGFTQCATLDTAAHDFCMISGVSGGEPHTALGYLGDKKYRLSVTSSAGGSSSLSVVCYDNIGTGGGGGGGGPGGLKNCAPVQGTSATAVACGYTVNAVCPTGKVAISGGTYQAGNISLQNTSPILTGGKMTGWYVTYVASGFCPDFNANNPSGKVVNGERPCFPLTGASVCGGATVVCCEE